MNKLFFLYLLVSFNSYAMVPDHIITLCKSAVSLAKSAKPVVQQAPSVINKTSIGLFGAIGGGMLFIGKGIVSVLSPVVPVAVAVGNNPIAMAAHESLKNAPSIAEIPAWVDNAALVVTPLVTLAKIKHTSENNAKLVSNPSFAEVANAEIQAIHTVINKTRILEKEYSNIILNRDKYFKQIRDDFPKMDSGCI